MVQAIISRRGGGSKVNGTEEEYTVAPGETVKKGDFVKPKITTTVYDAVTMPAPVQLLFKLNATKALSISYNSEANAQIILAILSVSGGTVTKGNNLVFGFVDSTGVAGKISFAQISEYIFALSILRTGGSVSSMYVYSYSGTTITKVGNDTFFGSNCTGLDICKLKDNEIVAAYSTGGTTNNCTALKYIWNGTSLSLAGGAWNKTFTSYPTNAVALSGYSDTQVISIFGNKGIIITDTGSDLVIGSSQNLAIASGSAFNYIVPTYDPSLFWARYYFASNIEAQLIMEVKDGIISPYLQSLSNYSFSQGVLGGRIEKITALCNAKSAAPSNTLYIVPYSTQLGTIDKAGVSILASHTAVISSVQLDENTMILGLYTTSSTSTIRLLTLAQTIVKAQGNEVSLGIALTGGSGGDTIKVAVPGGAA